MTYLSLNNLTSTLWYIRLSNCVTPSLPHSQSIYLQSTIHYPPPSHILSLCHPFLNYYHIIYESLSGICFHYLSYYLLSVFPCHIVIIIHIPLSIIVNVICIPLLLSLSLLYFIPYPIYICYPSVISSPPYPIHLHKFLANLSK